MKTIPYISTTGSVQTSVSGSTFVNIGDADAHEVILINRSGVGLEVKTANSLVAVPVAEGSALSLGLARNLAEVAVRRADQGNEPVTVHFVSSRLYVL